MFIFDRAISAYLADCKANEMSQHTQEMYARIIGKYRAHCMHQGMDPVAPATAADYKLSLAAAGLKLQTIATYLGVLSGFFGFCVKLGLAAQNPVLPDLMPPQKKLKAEKKPYSHLMTQEEIIAVFQATKANRGHKAFFLRNRAIVLMLLGCGMRNAELTDLCPCDLVFGEDDGAVIIRSGKGDKYRQTIFPMPVQEAVKAYLSAGIRPDGLTDNDPLFGIGQTAEEWHKINGENLSITVSRFIEAITGHKAVRSHACRHAFASQLLSSGVKVQEIQSVLGHGSIITTERYAAMLDPHAPVKKGNQVFNSLLSK